MGDRADRLWPEAAGTLGTRRAIRRRNFISRVRSLERGRARTHDGALSKCRTRGDRRARAHSVGGATRTECQNERRVRLPARGRMRAGRNRNLRGTHCAWNLAIPTNRIRPYALKNLAQCIERSIVIDHEARVLGAFIVGKLRTDARLRLRGFESALTFDSIDDRLPRGAHQPDFVAQRLPIRLDENRGFDNDGHLFAARAQTVKLRADALEGGRPHDRRQLVQTLRISEDDRAELLAIDSPIDCHDLSAEGSDHRVVGGAAGSISGMRDFVRVDNRRAELCKYFRGRALARTDSASETNCKHLYFRHRSGREKIQPAASRLHAWML